MAATWIKPLHVNKGKTIARTLADRTDYLENPDKTERGELVAGYACDPRTADEEFLLSKKDYIHITGRDQGKRNILAYHIRQSFKPGEITPENALEAGYELAARFTKNRHAFIVAVHTDKKHIHCHIVFNSTSLDCRKKFKNFWGSSFAIRRLSDIICIERGLSVIENPAPSKGRDYGDWLGGDKPVSWKNQLCQKIDEVLPGCEDFKGFVAAMKATGFAVKDNRKHISICAPGQKRAWRLKSLGKNYTEAAIRERLSQAQFVKVGGDGGGHTRVSLLVDIQAKLREGKGRGYEQWAKIFNLKQAAKTLVFLQENGIDSYEDLKKKSSSAPGDFSARTSRIKEIEARLKEIAELQKQIGTYSKTREVFAGYRASGWSARYNDIHAADIILHRAAKKYFDGLGLKKLPPISALKQEYAALAAEKKKLYSGYTELKELSRSLQMAKANADRLLDVRPEGVIREAPREKSRDYTLGTR